jgi:hypothetical protein
MRMMRLQSILFLFCTVFLGCSREAVEVVVVDPSPISVTNGTNITLSVSGPADTNLDVRLVSVSRDGSVTLEQVSTGERESGKPGVCFFTNDFGRIGLSLRGSSPDEETATLTLMWAEWE